MNIPSDVLQNHRFSYMYITYNICNIDHITGARAIAKNIHFSDNHVYFVPKDQLEKLAQVIQNDFLIFQVHGIRTTAPEKRHEMFGENINDKSIGTPINKSNEVRKYIEGSTELNKKSVLLAVARIRLSDLLLPYWQIKTEQRVVHPRVLRHLDKEEHFNKLTINEMMIESLKIFDQNPLTEKLLLSSGMSIHVAVQILNPLKNILFDLIEAKKFYNRLTIQVLNIGLAKSIVFNLFVHNSHWLQRENVAPKFIKRKRPILDIYEKNLITGFAVDCVDHCILFLEGHKKWILHLFWKLMRKEKKVNIKLMYNSDHLHYSRIYGALIPYGGIYFICMHVSPYQLLICASTYVKGDMPECCRRALHKLDMIRKSTRLIELSDDLYPTCKEIFGLCNEWGVPLHWPLEKEYARMFADKN